MGEVIKFPGHKYEILQVNYYYEIYKNDKLLGAVSDNIPGVPGFTYGFIESTEHPECQSWFIPNLKGWETVGEAIKELELEILREKQNEDNIGTTRNWEDDNPFE